MPYSLTFSSNFKKHYEAFTKKQQKQIQSKVLILSENPLHPSLRVKRIKGTADLWEMSVNMDVRIVMRFDGDSIILMIDIGHHDILKKYG